MNKTTLHERFLDKVIFIPFHSCWEWSAGKDKDGYGKFSVNGKSKRAHRFSYEHINGEIKKDMVVMHSCDNPSCVNPYHLKVGTVQDNNIDTVKKGRWSGSMGLNSLLKTHCPSGHEYSGENLGFTKKNHRFCRKCARAASLDYFRRKTGK